MNRICPNCFRKEGIRINFGGNFADEAGFHRQHWCNCGYSSSEKMMQDQDLGFDDPRWVRIVKYFLNEYYLRISQGKILNKDEHIRFFLKLLKSSANNCQLSVELIPRKTNEDWEFIYEGKPKKKPHVNIFDNSYDLEHLPEKVILTVNNDLLRKYNQSQQIIMELKKRGIKKNRWIVGLILLLLIVGIFAIFI
jgi:hypothetical protein